MAAALSALAISVAGWQLVKSRKDLIRERRADFRADQLAAIAVSLETSSTSGDPSVAARLRFLPPNWDMPVLRVWATMPYSQVGLVPLEALWQDYASPVVHGGMIGWVRQEGRKVAA
ncbi:hypothetical protein ACFXKJ_41765, partial [Kitasatospora indigofera]|uniref:hypothetical protein n=1 Tax=Kitasatospora indigofera TaxID=67307 RepID=UPI00368C24B2